MGAPRLQHLDVQCLLLLLVLWTVVFQRHRQQPGFEFLQAYLDDVHQDGHLDVAKHQLEQREDALCRCRLLDACVARSSHLGRIGSWDHEMGQWATEVRARDGDFACDPDGYDSDD